MQYTREDLLIRLLEAYASNYDLDKNAHDPKVPLEATAQMHLTEAKYALIKKAEMWRADSDEFVYFFSVPKLTDSVCAECIEYAYQEGLKECNHDNSSSQMCTRVVAFFIYDEIEPAAEARIKACKIYKSFQFSLHGWMEVHTVGADLGKGSAISNRYGVETAKFLKSVLQPSERKVRNKRSLMSLFLKK